MSVDRTRPVSSPHLILDLSDSQVESTHTPFVGSSTVPFARRVIDLSSVLVGLAGTGVVVWLVRQDTVMSMPHWWLWLLMLAASIVGGLGLRWMDRWLPSNVSGKAPAATDLALVTQDAVSFPSIGRRLAGLLSLVLAVGITTWVVWRLWPDYHQWQGTPLPWSIALLLTVVGGWLLGILGPAAANRQSPIANHHSLGWLELIILTAILALAIFVRIYRLDQIPAAIYVDETNAALDALQILGGRGDSPFGTGWYETPNGYIYYMAGLFKLFGANYWTLKAASLIPALLTVPALYLLARYLFGPLAALSATFLLAVSRWHMTMSRWGWNELMPPLFQVLGTYFLLRGLRTRRALDYALGGLITGLTIYTYLSSRLAIGTIALFAMYWVLTAPGGPWRGWKQHWRGLMLFGIVCLCAIAPIGVTYITDPFTFLNRAAEINIFHEVRAEGSLRPLGENIWRHILLFYQTGDSNGRQNLPGEPQTDPVTGTLLAVGLAFGLFNLRDRRYGLLWLWLVIAMAGGYLSELAIDSPNSYRTLTAVPAVVLTSGDVISRLARGFWHLAPVTHKVEPLRRWAGASVAGLLLLPALTFGGWWELHTYFVRQSNSLAVQMSFNQTETAVGNRVVDALQQGTTVYLSPRFYHFSPLRFLVYGSTPNAESEGHEWRIDNPPYELARPEVDLPVPYRQCEQHVRCATGADNYSEGGALFLLDSYYTAVTDYFREYYPNIEVEQVRGPDGSNMFLQVFVPASDLADLHGLTLRVTDANGDVTVHEVGGLQVEDVPTLGHLQGNHVQPPVALHARSNLSTCQRCPDRLEWRGSIRLGRSGPVEFRAKNATLIVDGEEWEPSERRTRYLGRGLHAVNLIQQGDTVGLAPVLTWRMDGDAEFHQVTPDKLFKVSPPQQGLTGTYYDNPDWAGEVAMRQVTPFLLLSWPPTEPVLHPFSAVYSGQLRIEHPGKYGFRLDADDGVRFSVNGQVLGEELAPDRPAQIITRVHLDRGLHSLRIEYFQMGGGSALEFFWQPPGQPESPVPPDALVPGIGD